MPSAPGWQKALHGLRSSQIQIARVTPPDHRPSDDGEVPTIALARSIGADLILMDDRDGVAFARAQGFEVTGTRGVLELAARRGLIDLVRAFTRLKATTFHYRQGLLDALLAQQPRRKTSLPLPRCGGVARSEGRSRGPAMDWGVAMRWARTGRKMAGGLSP